MLSVPVVFIIFNRPQETAKVFYAIRKSRPSKLFIVADGPRPGVVSDIESSKATRRVVEAIDWPCEVTRVYSEKNLGLRERILTGLDLVFNSVEMAIILEDDVLPDQTFFKFCEDLLAHHYANSEVALVSGYNFAPVKNRDADYFFSNSTYIWGWATWARTWKSFRSAAQVEEWSPEEINTLEKSFASQLQARDFLSMMKIAKDLNTWDISFAVWIRQAGLKTIVPFSNLVDNIGFGPSATHTKFEAFDAQAPVSGLSRSVIHPRSLEVNQKHEKNMWRRKALRWISFPALHPFNFLGRIFRYLKIRRP